MAIVFFGEVLESSLLTCWRKGKPTFSLSRLFISLGRCRIETVTYFFFFLGYCVFRDFPIGSAPPSGFLIGLVRV